MEYTLSITDKRRKQMDHKEEIFDKIGKIRKRLVDVNEYMLFYKHDIATLPEDSVSEIEELVGWLDKDMDLLNNLRVRVARERGELSIKEPNKNA